jgi:hypothetical protein
MTGLSKGKALGREDLACHAPPLWPVVCHRFTQTCKAGPGGPVALPPGECQLGQFQDGRS